MIQFALNYSGAAAELLRRGKIRVDRFKCPDWPQVVEEARRLCRVYVHFPLNAGRPGFDRVDLEAVAALAGETDTPFINVHLSPRVKDFPDLHDSDAPSDFAPVRARLIEDVARVVRRFGADRVMVETVPYGNPAEGFFRPATEPPLVRAICEATGCGLLLDLSHARITARVLGKDERDFIDRMPVDRLRELHVTGLGYLNGILKDHLPMTGDDWTMLQWALDRIRSGDWATPWCVACEYGGVGELFARITDADVIERQVPTMAEMVRGTG